MLNPDGKAKRIAQFAQRIGNILKAVIILSFSAVLFAVSSIAERKLELPRTGKVFYTLGCAFLPITVFAIAYFKVGKKFFIKTVFGTALLSIFLNGFAKIQPATEDRFLAFLYGSVIVGIGTAIILKANGSTGGTDLLANIIKTYKPHLKTGTLIVIFDTIIVVANTIFFKDIEVGLYSALAIYIMGKILDIFFEGINFTKMLLIISPKWEEISERINNELRRGTTALYGEGTYTKEKKKMLLCVMSRTEIIEARKIVEEIDPSAFIIITNAREVYGEGFKEG